MAKRRDLTGKRFGRLTVVRLLQRGPSKGRWLAKCECGGLTRVQAGNLTAGLTKSCGCGRGGKKEISGQRFGRLIVLSFLGTLDRKNAYWKVRCDCGEEREVQSAALRLGITKSCGCLSRDLTRTHGMEGTKVYAVWASMKARCSNPRHRAWKNYGGRGISFCSRWKKFQNFYADMGEPTGVLDRINNEGNYTPTNCRWASWSESNRNQRRHQSKEN